MVQCHGFLVAGVGFGCFVGIEAGDAAGDVRLHTGFGNRADRILAEEVHIGKRNDTCTDHFCRRQHGCIVNRLGGQSVLCRENTGIQPILQGKVFTVAAEQRHCRVRMAVVKTGHQKLILAADFAVENACGTCIKNACNAVVLNKDIAVLVRIPVFIQRGNITKKRSHSCCLHSNIKVCG